MVTNGNIDMHRARPCFLIVAFGAALVAAHLTGCGGPVYYPVTGKVVWEDGSEATELVGGSVEFESEDLKRSARGDIQPGATFVLGTNNKPDEGVPAGEYRVVVMPPPSPGERPVYPIERKFMRYETSGLTYSVQPTKNEAIVLTVERAKKR